MSRTIVLVVAIFLASAGVTRAAQQDKKTAREEKRLSTLRPGTTMASQCR